MDSKQVKELLLQALEHEMGGAKLYESAIQSAMNEDLKGEWEKYRDETQHHIHVLHDVFSQLQLDPEEQSPGRKIVHDIGAGLLVAMKMGRDSGNPVTAQIVACECIVFAETKDHLNWELIGQAAKKMGGAEGKALKAAYEEVEDQEDEHLYHTKGWCRELWMDSLGMKAVLPPPEERKHVKTAIGAARAEQERKNMR